MQLWCGQRKEAFRGLFRQLMELAAPFPRKMHVLLKKISCINVCWFCPLSSSLIRAGVAVQGPLVYFERSGWSVLTPPLLAMLWMVEWSVFVKSLLSLNLFSKHSFLNHIYKFAFFHNVTIWRFLQICPARLAIVFNFNHGWPELPLPRGSRPASPFMDGRSRRHPWVSSLSQDFVGSAYSPVRKWPLLLQQLSWNTPEDWRRLPSLPEPSRQCQKSDSGKDVG